MRKISKALDKCLTELCKARQEWHRRRIQALTWIESRSATAFDVAAEHCQIFDNVKHMDWFINAVAERVV